MLLQVSQWPSTRIIILVVIAVIDSLGAVILWKCISETQPPHRSSHISKYMYILWCMEIFSELERCCVYALLSEFHGLCSSGVCRNVPKISWAFQYPTASSVMTRKQKRLPSSLVNLSSALVCARTASWPEAPIQWGTVCLIQSSFLDGPRTHLPSLTLSDSTNNNSFSVKPVPGLWYQLPESP